ncbi:hypothetical protein [Campylobacter insulaenigrae]|uniref:hypothetical protein n=1 Tax=Campylobacter insulaenigrae TaxID=260714 RepID=UPI0021537010|nr:hypothetical protein [Campylobacter insulaenigrae]MCR6590502.1 hypothetical protein [Campylobacter insulaenigrae]MCR6592039.1 hypothetical protein [Campylobacter insulaenigrae]
MNKEKLPEKNTLELGKKINITEDFIWEIDNGGSIYDEHHILTYHPIEKNSDLEYVTFVLEIKSDYALGAKLVRIEKIEVFKNKVFKGETVSSTIVDYSLPSKELTKYLTEWVKNEVRQIMKKMD